MAVSHITMYISHSGIYFTSVQGLNIEKSSSAVAGGAVPRWTEGSGLRRISVQVLTLLLSPA